jgi:hypothetical protein
MEKEIFNSIGNALCLVAAAMCLLGLVIAVAGVL